MNYFQRKNYIKNNETKIKVVALEFYSQNSHIALNNENAIENFKEAFLHGHIGVEMIDKIYKSALKGEKLMLRAGNTIESVMPSFDEVKQYFTEDKK